MTPHLRHLLGLILAALTLGSAWAQTPEELAKLDPSELYYQAWSLTKDAEDLEEKKDFVGAFSKYRKAITFFDIIKINHPTHKADLVIDRVNMTTKAMEKIHDQALAQQQEKQQEGETPLLEMPGQDRPRLVIPKIINPNNPQAVQIQELRQEINRLQTELNNLSNQRDANAARLRADIQKLQQNLARLSSAPLRDDVAELNRQIQQLRRERDAMALARDQAVKAQLKTLADLEKTQEALAESRKEEQRLLAVIEKQTDLNGQVVAGQQKQIDDLRVKITEQDKAMAKVLKDNQDLLARFEQSQQMVAELQKERETLIAEKNQMANLLQMNEADRIQKLITQNVGLNEELNNAKANLELVQNDANSSKEKIVQAMQALTVAKARIQDLQSKNEQANLSVEKMKARLQLAEDDLLAQLNGGALNQRGKEEVTMLRGVVTKLKAKIAAQEGAATLLLEQAGRMGAKDEDMKEAMALLNGDEKMELTQQEQDFITRSGAPVSFKNASLPTEEEYNAATGGLRRFKEDLNGVAQRLFVKKDFQAARGNLELIIDEDPGAWEAMINLGIIHMRLDDPATAAQQFRQSILVAADRKVPFAHFMLGEALYRNGLYPASEEELRLSLSLEPNNAKAHVLLGSIAGNAGRLEDAEFHFKEAIAQDGNLYEPYINLAIIYIRQGKTTQAREHYLEYLRKGGPARPTIGEKLGV